MIHHEEPEGLHGWRIQRREVKMAGGVAFGVAVRDCAWADDRDDATAEVERLIAEEPGDHDLPTPHVGRFAARLVEDPDIDSVWRVSPLLSFGLYHWPQRGYETDCVLDECDKPATWGRFCSRRCFALYRHRDRGRAAYQLRAEDQWTWKRIGGYLPKMARLADPVSAAKQSAKAYAKTAGLPWPPLRRNAMGERE